MAKKSKSTTAPIEAAKRVKGGGAARKRQKRFERKLADLQAIEARRLEQLKEVRVKLADVRARLIEVRAEAEASGVAASSGEPAGPIGYCIREKRSVEISHPEPVTLSNGRSAIAGACSKCGARVMAFSARSASAGT
jgi:hypothetical protein